MSCFSYKGAEDLDTLISQDEPIELSSDSEPSSSSDDDLFGKTKEKKKPLGKRKRTVIVPQQKKQKVDDPILVDKEPLSSISEAIGILSSDDDDNELSLLVDDDPSRVLSETNRNITGTLCEIQNTVNMARNLRRNRRPQPNIFDLEDSPVAPKPATPKAITIHLLCEGEGAVKLKVSMNDSFGKILDVLSSVLDNVKFDEHTKMKLDGMPLLLSETPRKYQMKEGDEIKIYPQGQQKSLFEDMGDFGGLPMATKEAVDDSNSVKISVRTKDQTYKFGIERTDNFQKLFDGFCKHTGTDPSSVCFIFDGEELDLTLTPEDEDMDDGDLVEVQSK